MEIRKVSLIGLGAVGAIYGDKISKITDSFQVIVNGERKDRYEKTGVTINKEKKFYNFVSSNNSQIPQLLIVATKNNHLNQVIKDIENLVDENTIILSLLNGIVSERILKEKFPQATVLYSFAVGLSSENLKQEIKCSSSGIIVFGSENDERTEEVIAVENLFQRAGIEYKIPNNIKHDLWNKFMLNIVYNTISSILRAGYGVFKSEDVQILSKKVSKEVQLIASKESVILSDEDIENNQKIILSLDEFGKTSMCQDIEASRRTENKWFSKTIMELAKKHNIEVPYCESIYYLAQGAEYRNEMLKNK